jgi:hypothetical protein
MDEQGINNTLCNEILTLTLGIILAVLIVVDPVSIIVVFIMWLLSWLGTKKT